MTLQVPLTHDLRLSVANTWRMNREADGIDARIRVASAAEVTTTVRFRFRSGKAEGLVFCRQLDETTFQTESAVLADGLPRMELVLRRCPEGDAATLRAL